MLVIIESSQTNFCNCKMRYLTILFSFVVHLLMVPDAIGLNGELFEEKLELLSDKIERLEEKNVELELSNSQLKMKVSQMDREVQSNLKANESSPTSYNIFDCHLTESWSTDGVIKFNGCTGTVLYF